MKKIWILEKFAGRDEMRKSYDDMKALLEEFKKEGADEIKTKRKRSMRIQTGSGMETGSGMDLKER